MAENKQYVVQAQENGSVFISEDVISKIVLQAMNDVDGYAGISLKPGMEIIELIGGKNWAKGVKVTVSEKNQLSVECNVIINYGHSVMTVAQAIQEAAVSALQSVTGIEKVSIHVNVCGIVRQ